MFERFYSVYEKREITFFFSFSKSFASLLLERFSNYFIWERWMPECCKS